MKYKCCDYLLHQIVFDQNDIKPCCSTSMNKETAKFIDNFNGEDFDINEYIKQRKQYINMFKEGNIPLCCKDCPLIKEDDWNEDNIYFDRIIMANIAKCSCNCIYCVYTYDNPELKKYYNTKKYYDIKPILKKLRNNNLIKDDFILIIGGGECSEFPKGELEWLIYFTAFNNGKVQILSSGIKYSKAIEQILRYGKSELSISPDSGTKETFEKIKRVKAYNQVWSNIKKYIEAANSNKNAMAEIKYIIIPNINDNIKEVKSFLNKCKKCHCKNLHVDVEHHWYAENKNKPVPDNIKNIIKYINDNKEDMFVSYSVETNCWLNQVKED